MLHHPQTKNLKYAWEKVSNILLTHICIRVRVPNAVWVKVHIIKKSRGAMVEVLLSGLAAMGKDKKLEHLQ